jgi:hypothetical protein
MPAPGITERVDSHGLVTFGVEGEARLLHNSPIGAAVADGPSKPSLHHYGGSARILPDRTRRSASHDTVARLRARGAEILGEIAQFESIFLLCYLRGPAGIIVALAEQIG